MRARFGRHFLAREASNLAAELPRYEANLREKAKTAAETLQSVGVWHKASKVLERVEGELRLRRPKPRH